MSKIYTKTGDKGTTGTLMGRISKSDQLAHVLGTVDELNSWIGLIRGNMANDSRFTSIEAQLQQVQNNLLIIGSSLAGSELKISSVETKRLEKLIDLLTRELPKLSNFIFPTGLNPVGFLHVARTVNRRLEREVVTLEVKNKSIMTYLNRLSDTLFTLARWVNYKLGGIEEVWKK